jgi:Na+-transporting methylmalonyl-CoA/oxaloacetate decarboxylase gamma subunit
MQNAVLISLIGMGLVFIAILLVWGLMEILVRFTRERYVKSLQNGAASQPQESKTSVNRQKIAALAVAIALTERRQRAAIKAVEAVLANQERSSIQTSTRSDLSPISGWQSVMRASQRLEHQKHYLRRPRGRKL